ncbi:hypothetical protein J4E89_004754 [Alternaria sp. Ai002NY15]|nr:hypothetical protein J4E89_004754 [Alternaria sp. Ai002NY15]
MQSDADSNPIASLWEKLRVSMQESMFERTERKKFIPRSTFDEIFPGTASTRRDRRNFVLQVMGIEPSRLSEEHIALADYILDSAQKVFLIAVYIRLDRLHTAMELFKDDKFTDERLPVDEWKGDKLKCARKSHPFVVMEDKRRDRKKSPKRIWDVHYISLFQDDQWLFLSPTISVHEQNCNFDNRRPIPFIEKDTHLSSGAHGVVYKYAIHHAHFKNSLDQVMGINPLGSSIQTNMVLQYESKHLAVAVKAFRKGGKNVAVDVKREVDALVRMNKLGQKHIVRFITSFQRGTPADLEYYVLFEWADGGNLNDFWNQPEKPRRTAALVKWVIDQLCGLAKALSAAHYMPDNASYRHGDLKPGNILWFRGSGGYGTLKIGDWGEAKSHKQVTALRHGHVDTTAKYGTRRYEPPETGMQSLLPKGTPHTRSRLYDLWGMGCIIFEFIVWLLYSHEELCRFNNNNQGHYGPSDMFYEISRDHKRAVRIHRVVEHWMDHMAKDGLCLSGTTALGDLLKVVRTGLLVVDLPEDGGRDPQADIGPPSVEHDESPLISVTEPDATNSKVIRTSTPRKQARFRATELEMELCRIAEDGAIDGYWHQDLEPGQPPVDIVGSSHLSVPTGDRAHSTGLRSPTNEMVDYEHPSLDPEEWEFELDNDFASTLLSRLRRITGISPHQTAPSARLCTICRDFQGRLLDADFTISYATQRLRTNSNAKSCDLCCLLWSTCREKVKGGCKNVQFERVDSTVSMRGTKQPILTVLRSDGKSPL